MLSPHGAHENIDVQKRRKLSLGGRKPSVPADVSPIRHNEAPPAGAAHAGGTSYAQAVPLGFVDMKAVRQQGAPPTTAGARTPRGTYLPLCPTPISLRCLIGPTSGLEVGERLPGAGLGVPKAVAVWLDALQADEQLADALISPAPAQPSAEEAMAPE